jgi:hypothetical protein
MPVQMTVVQHLPPYKRVVRNPVKFTFSEICWLLTLLCSVYLRVAMPAECSGDQIGNIMPRDRPWLTLELIKHMPF